MPQVSKRPLSKKVEERIEEIFQKTISSLESREEVNAFLSEFLSPVEKIMLSKRLSIAVLLDKGYTYPQIAAILHVTSATIASVSLNLKYAGKGYKNVLIKLTKNENIYSLLGKIEDTLESLPPPKSFNPDYIAESFQKKQKKRNLPF